MKGQSAGSATSPPTIRSPGLVPADTPPAIVSQKPIPTAARLARTFSFPLTTSQTW